MINTTNNPNILICIPAYNEANTIGQVIKSAKKFTKTVFVFDDGSIDNTAQVSRNSGAIVIRNEKNEGYGRAISELFQIAQKKNADIMVTIDSDGQHDPDEIANLLRPLLNNECDIVIGSRFIRKDDENRIPRYRKVGIKTITKATNFGTYGKITDTQSGFRAYNKVALSRIRLYGKGMSISTEILLKAKEEGLRIIEVPITVRYDQKQRHSANPFIHGVGVLSSVIEFIAYSHPLLFYVIPGIVLLLVAGLFANQAWELYVNTEYISTNTILVSVGTALIGAVCLSTGAVIYTLTALIAEEKNAISSPSKSSIIKFIAYSHPLLFYVIPGIILLLVAGLFANQAWELYVNTEYISTNTILVSVGTALIGAVCLSTGAVIYTVMNLYRFKIHR